MSNSAADQIAQGDVVLQRFDGLDKEKKPKSLSEPIQRFREQHAKLLAAQKKVDDARAARDKALGHLGAMDDALDASLVDEANALAAAKLGTRLRPFANFSSYSPSDMQDLPYATEKDEVLKLVAAVEGKKPLPPAVAKATDTCRKNALAVEGALKALVSPQAAYTASITARDALLPDWQKAYKRLKKHAAAAWEDDEATYAAVFATPERVQKPKQQKVARKPAKKGEAEQKDAAADTAAAGGEKTPKK